MLRRVNGQPSVGSWSVQSLGNLISSNRQVLVAYAQRLVGDLDKAEELFQEAILKVLFASPELNDADHALAYFKRTISSLAIDHYRRESKAPRLIVLDESQAQIDSLVDLSAISPELAVEAAEDAAIVREAISLLSPAERTALIMWEIENRSAKEIAEELGIKEKSVKSTLARSRSSLRKILAQRVIDPATGATALDLLSKSYRTAHRVVQSSGKIVLSIIVLCLGLVGLANTFATREMPLPLSESRSSIPSDVVPISNLASEIAETSQSEQIASKSPSVKSRLKETNPNLKSNPLRFPGLDQDGVPVGFSVTDSTAGSLGLLFVSKPTLLSSEEGLVVSSIARTRSGGANILLNQQLRLDSTGTSFSVIAAAGIGGAWVPLDLSSTETTIERLLNGNYLLTANIGVKSGLQTSIALPSNLSGRDLEAAPRGIVARLILSASKTEILGEAILVKEAANQ